MEINRNESLEEALKGLEAKGFQLYIDHAVLSTCPHFSEVEVDYDFIQLGKQEDFIAWEKVDNVFFVRYGKKHVPDFLAVCAEIKEDPTLIDSGPIAIQWLDGDGYSCYAFFDRWVGLRVVFVLRGGDGWLGYVRFPLAL